MWKKPKTEKLAKIDKKLFEEICIEITKEDWYKREDYLHIQKDKIQTQFLRLHLQKIAIHYFPNDIKAGFPAIIVRRIATKMNLYVTDIVRT